MIQSFNDNGTEDIFDGKNTKDARKTCPKTIWNKARRKLDRLKLADDLKDLRTPPGNRLESLSGKRSDQYSIRINEQYRICFKWTKNGPEDVEITDYH